MHVVLYQMTLCTHSFYLPIFGLIENKKRVHEGTKDKRKKQMTKYVLVAFIASIRSHRKFGTPDIEAYRRLKLVSTKNKKKKKDIWKRCNSFLRTDNLSAQISLTIFVDIIFYLKHITSFLFLNV